GYRALQVTAFLFAPTPPLTWTSLSVTGRHDIQYFRFSVTQERSLLHTLALALSAFLPAENYYPSRPAMATSAPRVQTSSGTRPVGPTHVYPSSSQMMMISQQQLSFAGSAQGYFIPTPGQYRAQYMPPTQQYPVTSGTAGFYPATNPGEFPAYGKSFFFFFFSPPPPQDLQQHGRKSLIRIRDPNQGGRDITEEIMSGGRSTTTPTPPQEIDNEPAELATQSVGTTGATEVPSPLLEDQQSPSAFPPAAPSTPAADDEGNKVSTEVGDTVDAPVGPPASLEAQEAPIKLEETQSVPALAEKTQEKAEKKMEEVMKMEKEEQVASIKLQPAGEVASSITLIKQETATKKATEAPQPPPSEQDPAAPQTQNASPGSAPEPEPIPAVTAEPLLSNGLSQDIEELSEDMASSHTTTLDNPDTSQSQESTPVAKMSTPAEQEEMKEEEGKEKSEDGPPTSVSCPTMQGTSALLWDFNFFFVLKAAMSVPKKKKNMKEFNKKEAIGDLLDAFKEVCISLGDNMKHSRVNSPTEVADETWEEKEDKQNAESDSPQATPEPTEQKYQYKEEQWKPINPEEKKRYDREFLLGFQFISASLHKPEGLPIISDVVLDKVNKTPLRPADPARIMSVGPDFTPSYLGNLGSRSVGGPRGPPPGPRRSQQGQRKEPRKIISSMSLNDDVQLNKAEKAWKPSLKKPTRSRGGEEVDEDDNEQAKTLELLKRLRSILNKLTPQKFQDLMKQVTELTIDTEERLKGAIDLIFEKAISEPNFSVAYANMCRCLMGLKVPTSDKPGIFVNFRKLLLNRCQKEFEKDQDDDEIFERKQKEMEAEERERLRVELEESKDQARRRSHGNIKFIGELFKLKMLTEAIMHDCVVKLLKNHDEESLECLCRLLSTIGKDLDFEKAKPRMDQYFNQMDKIIKERKTSSRIRFMLQDVLDLRKNNWVPRRGDQGPKTIDQIHKEAEMEEHREQIKVQQQLLSKKDSGGGRMGGSMGGRGPHTPGGGRVNQPQDEGWNTVPISKNRPIDTTRLSKITKFDCTTVSLETSRSSSSSERGGDRERGDRDRDRFDRFNRSDGHEGRDDRSSRNQITKRSFSRESQERGGRGGDSRASTESVRRVSSMTDDRDRGSRDRGSRDRGSRDRGSRDRRPSKDLEALQCVAELNSASLLYVFVRNGVESTLERSTIAREHMGLLLHQLVKAGTLPTQQYYKGLQEILEAAEDMAIDIPHIWLYLAELITPMLHEGGITMGQLFREIAKPLVPLGMSGVLLVQVLKLLCKGMTPKKVGAMWMEAGLNWRDFLPKDEDVNKFVSEQKVEFTMGEENESIEVSKKVLSGEEMSKYLDRLLEDKANNQRIRDWIEANLDEEQTASNHFVRALMTSVCQSAIICDNPYRVDTQQINQRASLLQRYLHDDQKELQALYALQALMVHMEQPANLLRMFFDALYDEDVIKEEAFYKWETSKDPAEQTGKGVALKSVTAFFTWLREAEEESDKD
uniref:Eukaryotic translation initiation factor 4 gamma, 1a n=1 Tax=Mastacembelus armatus TaxID=205130 RepID=A0A7N8WQU3_9TELE